GLYASPTPLDVPPSGKGPSVALRGASSSRESPMLFRNLASTSLLVLVTSLVGCSGGSGGSSARIPASCGDAGAFCLSACNLSCADGRCGITDIAQNQPLVFTFSKPVDPRSVDLTTVSLKTVTGEEPVGTLVTEGQTVTFIPEVRTVQGATFFGFTANGEYVL